jgi:hypothetical protein
VAVEIRDSIVARYRIVEKLWLHSPLSGCEAHAIPFCWVAADSADFADWQLAGLQWEQQRLGLEEGVSLCDFD